MGCSHSTGARTPTTGHPQSHGVGPITTRYSVPMGLIQSLSLFPSKGPWHCCHPTSHWLPARSFNYVAPFAALLAFLRASSSHLAG